MNKPLTLAPGVTLWREKLDRTAQQALVEDILKRITNTPFYRPQMPGSGAPFSVEETNLGPLGWISDRNGYRYASTHLITGRAWPAIPEVLLDLWNETTAYRAPPECCLANLYRAGARMGLHQDRDEQAEDAPVLSVSLGDDAIFRIGGSTRKGATQSIKLSSGDVLTFGGLARARFMASTGSWREAPPWFPTVAGSISRYVVSPCPNKMAPDQGADRAPDAPLRAGAGRG